MASLFSGKDVKFKSILDIECFEIEEKKITCIVGESGGGKTTFLKLFNKMISPTSGEVYYYDTPLSKIDSVSHRKKVVMLSQKPYIFEKTILDNFKKLTEFNDLELDLEKAKKLLKDVSLKKELEVDASKLSGGEAQRLALARAMYLDSDVILLDEPSSALDDETEKIVIEMICNYVKENSKSLIMVTHSKKVAKTYADIIYTIDKGKIKEFNQIWL